MQELQGFLTAIRENPDEDIHRLVFADWLDETWSDTPQPRAAFIRVQCELAKYRNAKGEWRKDAADQIVLIGELVQKEKELWPGTTAYDFEGKVEGATISGWERGFMTDLNCSWEWWDRNGDLFISRDYCPQVTLRTPPILDRLSVHDAWCEFNFLNRRSHRIILRYKTIILGQWAQFLNAEWPTVKFRNHFGGQATATHMTVE